MARDDTEIVSALRAALADRVGKERFELWFGAGTHLCLAENTLTISAPTRFFLDFLRVNFRGAIEAACRHTLATLPELDFRVSQPSSDNGNGSGRHGGRQPSDGGPGAAIHQPPNGHRAKVGREAVVGRGRPPTTRRFADFDSFVVGPTNKLAQAAAELVAERPGELSPLLIHGPTSVGKTHLLEGIWSAARKNRTGTTAVYLTAEQFATGFLQALRGSGLPSFRRKYRGVDLLIIDDLQFLSGKKYTQVELLYTVDTLLREGRQLVFAGDRRPEELCDLGPELTTRLKSGMVCEIKPADQETRLGIVAQMARRFGMDLPDEVATFIASRLTQHARELSGALCRLQACSQAWGRRITLEMAEESLADLVAASRPVIRLPDIEKAVCKTFGLDPNTLQSGRKAKRVSHPRMLAMWLARRYTRSALSEIGHYFGHRSHSTVISAQKRVDAWLSTGTAVELADQTYTIDEAIRQVEQRLRAS